MKKVITIIIALALSATLSACRSADMASYNLSKAADEFNITRKITVVNMRTDEVMFEIEGTMSLKNNSTRELEIICKIGDGTYKKHFVYLNDWTSYVVEDISGADIDPYHYHISIYPLRYNRVDLVLP